MMGETFKYAAPVAGALGYNAEDVAEAIGLMANSGIKASQAGTGLRTIMTKLNKDFTVSGKELGKVKIATTNADGSMRELSDILGDTRAAFSKLSESEKAHVAQSLVGENAMSAFLALMQAAPADVDKLKGAIQNCDGAAKKMADTMSDNLKGDIDKLKSAWQDLQIELSDTAKGPLRDIVQTVTNDVIDVFASQYGARHVTPVATFALAAQDVVNGSAFAMTAELPVATSIVGKLSGLGIVHFDQEVLGETQSELGVSIGVRKNDTDLLAGLNSTLAKISKAERESLMGAAIARSGGAE
jgi:TP901 family phage tail tape measure protein